MKVLDLRTPWTDKPAQGGCIYFFYFCKLPMLLVMSGRNPISYIIGIDEVGRGPLAGPVVVCAVAVPRRLRPSLIEARTPLRDSKKLSASQRNTWVTAIKADGRIRHAVAAVTPRVIDRINVTQAANRAATRALEKLLAALPASARIDVFLDGGLFVNQTNNLQPITNNGKRQTRMQKFFAYTDLGTSTQFNLKIKTVVKGDETIPAISLASIVAKEHRDALMKRAHKKYPLYGFDRHAGYGTKKHIAAIKKNGRTPLHRNSFLKKIV